MYSSRAALQDIVNGWADEVRALGVEVKGLWLVDFDNGEGYYCWKYPEETVGHYHGYEEGSPGGSRFIDGPGDGSFCVSSRLDRYIRVASTVGGSNWRTSSRNPASAPRTRPA
jgi:hypothetical protein